MIPRMRTRLLVLLLAACSHSKPAATTAPMAATAAPTCEQTGEHMIGLLSNKNDSNAEMAKQIQGMFVDHCNKDGWSADARSCIGSAKEMNDTDACKSKLTQPQLDALEKSFNAPGPTAGAAPAEAPPPASPPPPPAKSTNTRAPVQKEKGKGTNRSGDPCEGGQ